MRTEVDMNERAASRGARRTDPSTSHSAARRTPELRDIDRHRVLLTHYNHPSGLTDFELGDLVGRQQTSAGKRRGELRDDGYIEETSERRKAPSGAPAVVWQITRSGKRFAELLGAGGRRRKGEPRHASLIRSRA